MTTEYARMQKIIPETTQYVTRIAQNFTNANDWAKTDGKLTNFNATLGWAGMIRLVLVIGCTIWKDAKVTMCNNSSDYFW